MEFYGPGGARCAEIDEKPLDHDLQLIRIIIGESTYLLAVVNVNTFGHGLDLQPSIDVIGVTSHIVNIDDTIAQECASVQLQRLPEVLETVRRRLEELSHYIYASCSVEAPHIRETDLTCAGAGKSICGYCPSRETGMSWSGELQGDNFNVQPVLAWKTLLFQLCQVGEDASVGNGRTWPKRRFSELVVIPVAYADGYSDTLGNRGRVLFRGRSATVVGRVCMSIPAAVGIDSPGVSVNDDVIWEDGLALSSETFDCEFSSRPSPAATQAFL